MNLRHSLVCCLMGTHGRDSLPRFSESLRYICHNLGSDCDGRGSCQWGPGFLSWLPLRLLTGMPWVLHLLYFISSPMGSFLSIDALQLEEQGINDVRDCHSMHWNNNGNIHGGKAVCLCMACDLGKKFFIIQKSHVWFCTFPKCKHLCC